MSGKRSGGSLGEQRLYVGEEAPWNPRRYLLSRGPEDGAAGAYGLVPLPSGDSGGRAGVGLSPLRASSGSTRM